VLSPEAEGEGEGYKGDFRGGGSNNGPGGGVIGGGGRVIESWEIRNHRFYTRVSLKEKRGTKREQISGIKQNQFKGGGDPGGVKWLGG